MKSRGIGQKQEVCSNAGQTCTRKHYSACVMSPTGGSAQYKISTTALLKHFRGNLAASPKELPLGSQHRAARERSPAAHHLSTRQHALPNYTNCIHDTTAKQCHPPRRTKSFGFSSLWTELSCSDFCRPPPIRETRGIRWLKSALLQTLSWN